MPELAEWEAFYLIVGAAAGALIGLQFVVMTLIASIPRRAGADAGAAFGTPTIVHFSSALFLSALIQAPWHKLTYAAASWGVFGFVGVIYLVVVIRRMKTQTTYEPELEDWVFHALLPFTAYSILALTALAAPWYLRPSLFGVGASVLLLLFIGIHNAWDTVTYHVFTHRGDASETAPAEEDMTVDS
jgi:hypothetical protein